MVCGPLMKCHLQEVLQEPHCPWVTSPDIATLIPFFLVLYVCLLLENVFLKKYRIMFIMFEIKLGKCSPTIKKLQLILA